MMARRLKTITWFIAILICVSMIAIPVQEVKDTWQSWSSPLFGKVIVIDPGHGGPDAGASGANGTEEKGITLNLSNYLKDYLQEAGAIVYLTRADDRDLSDDPISTRYGSLSARKAEDIRNRIEIINESNADLYVSLHLNASTSSSWRGAQTFFNPTKEDSERLAKLIQGEIRDNLENTNREAAGLRNIYILKHAEPPGALVEGGFLSNPQERKLLESEDYQRKIAASIYRGILKYTTEE
ncbi:N-acetylmuramoyl-L-alanine amidase CwlD [Halobacillus andaensis]|uniref:N-acetylmuramoyl-L-alanine amidase CwlD n=1 Tax=Halobacillus andaensis TaxID=1176239 RepID=A0A917EYS0_HALAA|nr:N-acetylmuramoyl-L-alanine amidase CwlD [Halobacillus andaensis]MBP2006643.1 N-acetylmuramoyl-L-alanine amidase [Halobacillus andaensis]GGF34944.1 N-acetylmuramoyl-L-alanine amidase CwlD [Halobacillus andaensis]